MAAFMGQVISEHIVGNLLASEFTNEHHITCFHTEYMHILLIWAHSILKRIKAEKLCYY